MGTGKFLFLSLRMGRRNRAAVLPTNIALLQNLIRRDPKSYEEEFRLQQQHYGSLRDIFFQNPRTSTGQEQFAELVGFITQMCSLFPQQTKEFPDEICQLITEHHDGLNPQIAEKIVHSISMLRNKDILSNDKFVQTLFPVLISTESKRLRSQIYAVLTQMVKSVNEGAKNQKVNRMLQALLFNLLEEAESNGLWATKITRELWRRGIWDDSRTVEIMSNAAIHPDTKVASSAIRFFLGADKERDEAMADDSDSDLDLSAMEHKMKVNKKSNRRKAMLESAHRSAKRKINGPGKDQSHLNFSAIQLLRDPQGFAERLYATHLQRNGGSGLVKLNLEQKIDCVNLVARLVGTHKLTVLGLYSFLLRYLTPKQANVTQFMAASAQATHDLVPPDVIHPLIRKIADEFVSDGVAAEVAAAGINTIREIAARAPLAMDEPMLHDIVAYRGSKSKSVVMAARGLIQLYRDLDPSLLPAKERGKTATMSLRAGEQPSLKYGQEQASGTIEGLDLLQKWKENNPEEGEKDEDKNWEIDSDAESEVSDEDWHNVESDGDDIQISDSDDEKDEKDSAEKPAEKSLEDLQKLAATEVLTPADFARLDQLKAEHGMRKAMGQSNEDIIDAMNLTGVPKYKQNKEERLQHVREGREDREFGSRKRHHMEKPHSTTNKQKARKKNFLMAVHKRDVQGKAKMSLRDKQKILRAHIDRQKKKLK